MWSALRNRNKLGVRIMLGLVVGMLGAGMLLYLVPGQFTALAPNVDVVAEIDGGFFYLSPGESWARRSEWDPAPECHRISITRLSNFGLLAPEELNRPH